jgi:hypothetical protein
MKPYGAEFFGTFWLAPIAGGILEAGVIGSSAAPRIDCFHAGLAKGFQPPPIRSNVRKGLEVESCSVLARKNNRLY